MEVATTVDLKRPALLLFDPRDEMVVFPASLLATLTKRFYRAEEDAALRLAYRGGVAATRRLMTRLGLTTEDLRRGGEMTLYASDRPEDFGALAGMFLGQPLQGAVRPVDIEKY